MSGGHQHGHALFLHAPGHLHRLRPQCKVAATILFIFAVVATPREAFWAYGCYVVVLAALAGYGRVPLSFLLRRLVIETPFVAFALFLPILGQGPRVEVVGLSLSIEGLWAAWNILIKGTLGVAATIVLAATTPIPELLHGLERLRMPKTVTAIAGFMVRYLDVILEEMRRMNVARVSRGYNPRWIWQAKALASSAGALFIRSYERGERVYLAMLSRGFQGTLPLLEEQGATKREWATAMLLPAAGATIAALAWTVRP